MNTVFVAQYLNINQADIAQNPVNYFSCARHGSFDIELEEGGEGFVWVFFKF